MIKITLPQKEGMKEKVYDMWYDLHLTGYMRIERRDKNYIVMLEPEKGVSLSLLRQKLSKESIIEEDLQDRKIDTDVFTQLNPEKMDI